jgi:multidrug transporter EmrE-like cation transporter
MLNTSALIALKLAVLNVAEVEADISITFFVNALRNLWLWIGAFCFISGVFFWTKSLTYIDLSLAYPTSSVSYIVIIIISYFLFDEPINAGRIFGICLIIMGVVFLYRPQKKTRDVRLEA